MTLHYWQNDKGTIARLVHRPWAIETYAILANGVDGPVFVSADKGEAIAWGDTLAQAVCEAMNAKGV